MPLDEQTRARPWGRGKPEGREDHFWCYAKKEFQQGNAAELAGRSGRLERSILHEISRSTR
jgi:hypothetical protein